MSERLKELIRQLPSGLRADWDGTNHYELTTAEGIEGFWWLTVDYGAVHLDSRTEPGRRLGLLLDIAEELARMRDAGEVEV